MERLGIGQYADQCYTELSGGQRQMVIIARALAQQPDLLIMDEPTASLDYGNQYLVLAQMRKLSHEGMGVLMVTHDPDHALYCADRIVAMRDGRIVSMGGAREVVREDIMKKIYGMTIKVRDVGLSAGKNATVCIPVPDM
jgi:iron complex transport system ATP-binding protein